VKPRIVLTDLDGTLLEPDGSICPEALSALELCRSCGVPVCPVTSKTPDELTVIAPLLSLSDPAGFENGAGVRLADGRIELTELAVPIPALRDAVNHLRLSTGFAIRSVEELDDDELASLTQRPRARLPEVRRRFATLPLVVPEGADEALRAALPQDGGLRLVRGNRFLHLQGMHSKADVVPRLVAAAGLARGLIVSCGDSPNDLELLAAGDVRIIVPGPSGPHPELRRSFPDAVVAPHPHGRGWAAALVELIKGSSLA
jgi:mannosyl-3-phosphoglycerate phosphatase